MDPAGIVLREMSREKEIPCGLTYRWNLQQNQTKVTSQTQRTVRGLLEVGVDGGWTG